MMITILYLAFCLLGQSNAFSPPLPQQQSLLSAAQTAACSSRRNVSMLKMADDETNAEGDDSQPVKSNQYDVSKLVGGQGGNDEEGGFNQFDPVLSATGFLSRRFGIAGGLAVVAAIALLEGREIVNGLADSKPLDVVDGEPITTASGLKLRDTRIGKGGSAPLPGYIIGLKLKVIIGDKVIYQTAEGEKPVAFKYGQRPFQNVICEGVEEGIKGMKVGGKRVLEVPSSLGPPGVELPPGVPLIYEVELTEVLSGYF